MSFSSVQERQKVHSNEQIIASVDSAGRSLLQHSQLGRSSSIVFISSRVIDLGFQHAEDAGGRSQEVDDLELLRVAK